MPPSVADAGRNSPSAAARAGFAWPRWERPGQGSDLETLCDAPLPAAAVRLYERLIKAAEPLSWARPPAGAFQSAVAVYADALNSGLHNQARALERWFGTSATHLIRRREGGIT